MKTIEKHGLVIEITAAGSGGPDCKGQSTNCPVPWFRIDSGEWQPAKAKSHLRLLAAIDDARSPADIIALAAPSFVQ